MRNWKNVSIGDWAKMMGAMFCVIVLGNMVFRAFMHDAYLRMAGHLLGMAGWLVIYLRIVKAIDRKNGITE